MNHISPELPSRPPTPPKDTAPRRYKGAGTTIDEHGYVWEWCPTHPAAGRGVVLQHRLIVECRIGRFLTKRERVHHRNHVRWDNRDDNLTLHKSHADHMRAHWSEAGRRSPDWIERVRLAAEDGVTPISALGMSPTTVALICKENQIVWRRRGKGAHARRLTEQRVREALQGRTTEQAARMLGCHPMTLYKRFDHLLSKRASPGSLDQHQQEIQSLIQAGWKRDEIADRFGVSRVTILKAIRRWIALGAKPGEFDSRVRVPRRSKPTPSRMAPGTASPRPEHASAPPAS